MYHLLVHGIRVIYERQYVHVVRENGYIVIFHPERTRLAKRPRVAPPADCLAGSTEINADPYDIYI